ncbi:hypothetical protein CLAFUW4_07291 [Fulvia fulva]|uniref:Uncharacterized protein n=1 Tax=Passalora fulva TaxID=5499 RepID=A0A9Q8PA47_PASFU|nr:uncharacterized protein CLAFUR5_07421 [Fulvia fulva]KAK4621396.1 hypothetical protein CLAFUR4_07299 [Fulvia fulva]KAK4623425.1 hypothetical protein CLAFUR0_07297 [Fulvia fulva]UJO18688.1 hypothetical protein CLAFUR5_07421 [Fulvia fulva]WPV16546.1 hypothetical protein CLAFUW4_07291 [Fulvia fulva]WPV31236.1 hypothetical protein CLAFUW7_07293 [Fulvia fulva]
MENSRLGNLPAELRNLIYEFTLRSSSGVEIWTEPGILRTCKQIRAEAEQMFYAVNDFFGIEHEDNESHGLCCQWLKTKASYLPLIRSLTIRCEMPSLGRKVPHIDPAQDEEIDDEVVFQGFYHQLHIMDELREAQFGRDVGNVVRFTLNGAHDAEHFDKIDAMSTEDQDRYRSAKFLIFFLVYGLDTTMDNAEASTADRSLRGMDDAIQQRRLLAGSMSLV